MKEPIPLQHKRDNIEPKLKSDSMEITSINFARLFSWLAYYKHNTILNKTQMQKLLFIFYGVYLAEKGVAPFADDTPKAWPHGPVFPRVNIRYTPNNTPDDLVDSEKKLFMSDGFALQLADKVVRRFHSVSAYNLSEWSHQKGSPWYNTIYGKNEEKTEIKWNTPISDEYTKDYFKGWYKLIDKAK